MGDNYDRQHHEGLSIEPQLVGGNLRQRNPHLLCLEELDFKLAENWGKRAENLTGHMERREGRWTLEGAWHADVALALTGF